MFEWHGWLTIRATASAADLPQEGEDDETAVTRVNNALSRFEKAEAFETYDVRHQNGQLHVWMAGFRNHRQDRVIELYREIAAAAPGSYGVMYVLDDELPEDASIQWQRWVMRRGVVINEADRSLSPHIPTVEDAFEM